VLADGLVGKVLIPAVVAPILAFLVAGIAIGLAYRVVGRQRPGLVTAASSSARSSPAGCWRWRTAPTTRRRRWA
jgi:phosphate/sulfate permease